MCKIEECLRLVYAKGWCRKHYMAWWKYGDPLEVRCAHGTLEERFWPKVDRNGSVPAHAPDLGQCLEWTAARKSEGYGMIGAGGEHGRPLQAHRVAYELVIGPIPEGLVLDHLCRNRGCVNPAHLEPVTDAVNVLRGVGPSAEAARQDRCKRGHLLTPENVYTPPSGGRKCLECNRVNCGRYQARRRERQRKSEAA